MTAAEQGRTPPVFAEDARDALTGYTWPGNVRELRNAIERALVLCGDTITAADLPDRLRDAGQRTRPVQTASDVRGHLAGAESLVMSLWEVDDAATRDLMDGYYKKLKAGLGRSAGLQAIQNEMHATAKYAHPYYWASFVAAGDSAPLPK